MLYSSPCEFDYDVALTFPGELRPLAEGLAEKLEKEHQLKVFCESDIVGKSFTKFEHDYAKQQVLIVPFFSMKYGYSMYCQREWQVIRENLDYLHDRIYPLRFDETVPGNGISEIVGKTLSNMSDDAILNTIPGEIVKKLRSIQNSWQSEESRIQLTVVGSGPTADEWREILSTEFELTPNISCISNEFFDKESSQKNTILSNDLVVIVGDSELQYREKTLMRQVITEPDNMCKKKLFLIAEMEPTQNNRLVSWFEKEAVFIPKFGVTTLTLPRSLELSNYLSCMTQPLCNVFFDDPDKFGIWDIREELHSKYGSIASAVRWHDLSVLNDQHCYMIDSACRQSKLRENIYLISENFPRFLALDGKGHPENSSVASLLPRFVHLRTEGKAMIKQTFMIAQDDTTRLLSDQAVRGKLTHYWCHAELLRPTNKFTDKSALTARISAILNNAKNKRDGT